MGLDDLFHHFDKSEYTARMKSSTDNELVQRDVVKTRQHLTAYFSGGTYLGMAIPTCGASLIMAPLTARRYYISRQKLKIVQAELERRNIPLYETRKRDVAISALTGTIGLAVGIATLGVTDGLTDSLTFTSLGNSGASGASGASAIDALSADPFSAVGDAVQGAVAQFQEVSINITGDTMGQTILPEGQIVELHDLETGATADMIVATPEVAGAWNMGVHLAQSAEKALAQSAFLDAAGSALVMEAVAGYGKSRGRCCPRLLGVFGAMNCDCCGEHIGKRQYHHCCLCASDDFDLCQACYSKGSRCLSASHDMTLLQLATNQDLSSEMPIVNLYPNWKHEAIEFVTRSQLSGGEYTLFGCDHCGEAIRQGNCYHCFHCGNYDSCERCYKDGSSCGTIDHVLTALVCAVDCSSHRYWVSDCRRSEGMCPGIQCSSCHQLVTQGRYYHCCNCDGDDFDICHACYKSGERCKNPTHHTLQLHLGGNDRFLLEYPETCARRKYTLQSSTVYCDHCSDKITRGSFYHCCKCEENYD
ncbi:uncharacterized protein BDZ83DRAFT_735456, partial [Colletotrichum acutatum]